MHTTECVNTTEVVPMGRDSFMLTATAWSRDAGKEMAAGAKAANAYCNGLSKHMIVRRMDSNGRGLATVIFSCVSESDPEYKRPDLTKDPSVIIQDNRSPN